MSKEQVEDILRTRQGNPKKQRNTAEVARERNLCLVIIIINLNYQSCMFTALRELCCWIRAGKGVGTTSSVGF